MKLQDLKQYFFNRKKDKSVTEKDESAKQNEPSFSVYYHPRFEHDSLGDFDDYDWQSQIGFDDIGEKVIDVNGREVICLERFVSSCLTQTSYTYFLVPGFVIGEAKKYDPETGQFSQLETRMSKVEKIKDKENRAEIKNYLISKGIGSQDSEFCFW